jgi:hypothetical protein
MVVQTWIEHQIAEPENSGNIFIFEAPKNGYLISRTKKASHTVHNTEQYIQSQISFLNIGWS